MPKRIDDLKRGAARTGALTALSRAKAWQADLDPEDLANGGPSVKEDGTTFSTDNFAAIARAMRPLASKLADETNLGTYQAAYNAENKRVSAPVHQPTDLIPPIRKHTFAPEIDPAGLIDDDAEFKALSGIDWSSSTFQAQEQDKEVERVDQEASGNLGN